MEISVENHTFFPPQYILPLPGEKVFPLELGIGTQRQKNVGLPARE